MSLLARIFGLGGRGTVETAPWRDADPQRHDGTAPVAPAIHAGRTARR